MSSAFSWYMYEVIYCHFSTMKKKVLTRELYEKFANYANDAYGFEADTDDEFRFVQEMESLRANLSGIDPDLRASERMHNDCFVQTLMDNIRRCYETCYWPEVPKFYWEAMHDMILAEFRKATLPKLFFKEDYNL